VLPPVLVLASVAIGLVPAATGLAAARWPCRSPAAAIVLWQAMGLGWGLAAIGTLAALGTDRGDSGVAGDALTVLARAVHDLIGEATLPGLIAALRLLCLTASAALLALLCWVLVAASGAVLRDRRRHRALLSLLAHGDPKVPGALVVDHPAAAAYCVPGLRSRIVISAGAIDLLDQAELAAVLAHERAHARERHDLVLLPFTALCRAFPWSGSTQRAYGAVALLIEMLADDHALRHRPARELVTALIRVGAAGPAGAPAGALAVAGRHPATPDRGPATPDGHPATPDPRPAESGVCARVERLLAPAPGLSLPALTLVSGAATALVVVPVALLLFPV
jgi:Zn-dependent protease with chaperone function